MSDERKNAFERRTRPKPSLADDRKNRFTRHAEAVTKRRADTTAHDSRVAKLEGQRERWNRLDSAPITTSGVRLDKELSELKRVSDADREQRRAPQAQRELPSRDTVAALINGWHQKHPEFYAESELNMISMLNGLLAAFDAGKEIRSVEAVDEIYQWLVANNHIEPRPAVRRRGKSPRTVPVVFQYTLRRDREAWDAEDQEAAREAAEQEAQQARELPFEELRTMIRKMFRQKRPR